MIELLIAMAIILTIVTVAIPSVQKVLDHGSEVAVAREMQTIHQAQIQYMTQHGGYATGLEQLGPKAAGLIPKSLASREKNGYVFTLNQTPSGYAVHAAPRLRVKERRNFYLDENGIVHQSTGQTPATEESPELK